MRIVSSVSNGVAIVENKKFFQHLNSSSNSSDPQILTLPSHTWKFFACSSLNSSHISLYSLSLRSFLTTCQGNFKRHLSKVKRFRVTLLHCKQVELSLVTYIHFVFRLYVNSFSCLSLNTTFLKQEKTNNQQACLKTRFSHKLQYHKINFGLDTRPLYIFDPKERIQYLSKNVTFLGQMFLPEYHAWIKRHSLQTYLKLTQCSSRNLFRCSS